ncbi:Siroheme decarboxylase NirH subunit [uncultured Gammaproteobacteria bacterium]
MSDTAPKLTDLDRRLIAATQAGLPLAPQPYHVLALSLGVDAELVMERFRILLESGVVRRIAAVPNHYRLGWRANGMSVWDVAEERLPALGPLVGALECVTHCYHRPRRPPDWPYTLFAMVHGHDRSEVEAGMVRIAEILGPDDRGHTVLYSTRILKKTGLRIS